MDDVEQDLTVDGEVFCVVLHEDGGFDCEWLTGQNPGYGFWAGAPAGYTVRAASGTERAADPPRAGRAGVDRVTKEIRVFLSMIDPDTGFIGD